ncbi:MAG: TonB-dependent receptor [Bacteroidales bacterium]|nr:TonB-dependent receptor [Bacteroidales bacterium]
MELDFKLNTFTGNIKAETNGKGRWKHTFGMNTDYQENAIEGYNFLLPQYKRTTFGFYAIEQIALSGKLKLVGGARVDRGNVNIREFKDTILEDYLNRMNIYTPSEVLFYSNRSRSLNRWLTDFSGSVGFIYTPDNKQIIKLNTGRSFRLPAANELSANGVHHGTFRHEAGDTALNSEIGYQLDLSYTYETSRFYISLNPFVSWFTNYIFLEPTGEWSVLPHAGQIYRYNQAEAFIGGGEFSVSYEFVPDFTFESAIEYVYLQNLTDGYPLPFSPPASVLNGLTWHLHKENKPLDTHFRIEHRYTVRQSRIARNEEETPGYNLFDLGITSSYSLKKSKIEVNFQVQNIFDKRYYNHLSYYRKLNIPEMGRNVQFIIKYIF